MKSSALLSMSLLMAHIAHPFVAVVNQSSPSITRMSPITVTSWPQLSSNNFLSFDPSLKTSSRRTTLSLDDGNRNSFVSSEGCDALGPLEPLQATELERMLLLAEYANVPYCARQGQIENWSCGKCQLLPNTTVHQVIEAHGTLAYIAESSSNDLLLRSSLSSKRHLRHLLVVVRGTVSWQNLVQDFNYPLRPWRYALPPPSTTANATSVPPVLATSGFMITYDAIRDQLQDAVRQWIERCRRIKTISSHSRAIRSAGQSPRMRPWISPPRLPPTRSLDSAQTTLG
ncbi:hypothetical protein BCR44DRAFT_1085682 [Catenaria anguillulae PL171]|uniref:Uncharacterized protein n=1 Tax=Catenaria anguillulae PL171 TaxID=765915 RepID=A0A1Y2HQP2_9FUNG|nr:hypothetical protein BCR44DRAFT_1085682 [Catenaria anguillulae PL171]